MKLLSARRAPGVAASTSRLLPYTGIVMVCVLLILGFSDVPGGLLYLLTVSAAWGIAAIGLDLSTGLAGQALFGQTAFVAISAYAFTTSWSKWDPTLLGSAVFAIVVTAVIAAVIGSAMVRLKHLGAVLVTFFFAFVIAQLATGTWLQSLTGGVNGLPAPTTSFDSDELYFLSTLLLGVVLLVAWNYRTSRSGWALQLVKRNETVAETMGINPAGRKLAVFVFAAVLAGITGVLLTLSIGFIAPDTFAPTQSIILFAMVALGGIGSISGGILGAVVLTCLPYFLHGTERHSEIIYALVLLFFLVVRPDGVVGFLGTAAGWVNQRVLKRGGRADDDAIEVSRSAAVVDAGTAAEAARQAEADAERVGGLGLVVGNLNLAFGGVKALDGLSLAVADSSIHAIIGPNGAGKTSLLNCISGVQNRWTGSITIGETPISPRSNARHVASLGVSRTFQNASLVLEMSAVHNVALGLYKERAWSSLRDLVGPLANGRLDRQVRREVDEALDLVGIARARRLLPVKDLSLAESKLIDVARAVVAKPRLLLLDEPTAGLSGDEIELCASFIGELNATNGTTIVVVSHHVGFIRRLASRATVLDYGRVIGDGEPNALLGEDAVVAAFLGDRAVTAAEQVQADQRLRVRNLSVRFGHARVLENVSFDVSVGEIVGLAGRNGVGKTTALRAIAGAVPKSGESSIEFDGRRLPRGQSRIARLGICWVPEGRQIIPNLTVAENLRYGALAVGQPADAAAVDRVVGMFPTLAGLMRQQGGTLSGGQQQQLAIARGVIANPKILMIDEMSLGLAPRAIEMVSESVVTLRSEGIGLLLVDQNVRSLARICDRLVVLTDGVSAEVDLADEAALAGLTSLYF